MRTLSVMVLGFLSMGLRGGCDFGEEEFVPANQACLTHQDCVDSGLVDHVCAGKPDSVNGFMICIDRKEFERIVVKEKIVEVPVEKIVEVRVEVPVEVCTLPDAGVLDAGVPDASVPDDGGVDAGAPDDGGTDAGDVPDAGLPDAGVPNDGGSDGGGTPDASDAGNVPDAGVVILPIRVFDFTHTETETCATFTWKTDVPTSSVLNTTPFVVGTKSDFAVASYRQARMTGARTNHQMQLCGFTPATRYTAWVAAEATNAYGELFATFTTLSNQDREPPEVMAMRVQFTRVSEAGFVVAANEEMSGLDLYYRKSTDATFTRLTYPFTSSQDTWTEISVAGLTAGAQYFAYVVVYDLAGNTSQPSQNVSFVTQSLLHDIIAPTIEAFGAGADILWVKAGFFADEPLMDAELWLASSEAALSSSSTSIVTPFVMPTGRSSVSGGSITSSTLTANILYYAKVVGSDMAGNESASSVFLTRTLAPPVAPPALTAQLIKLPTNDPAQQIKFGVATLRPVMGVEVQWSYNAGLTSPTSVVGQGGAQFEELTLAVPSASTIFFKAIVRESASSTPLETPVDTTLTWATFALNEIAVGCDAGPTCSVTVYSTRNPGGETGRLITFPFRALCQGGFIDNGAQELMQIFSTNGPDTARAWWVTGEPINTGSGYQLPTSVNRSRPMVAVKKTTIRCDQVGLPTQ